jgi:hypothetical protein
MALIVPTATSTFADACQTGGGPLRKYVLAQYPGGAALEWVRELRTLLVKDELKYRDFREARPRLMGMKPLWENIEKGLAQATIIVIDPEPVAGAVLRYYHEERAEPGIDYTQRDVIDQCATALVAGTPITHLTSILVEEISWSYFAPVIELRSFAPAKIRKKLGGGLKDAVVFAARAHAMFDLEKVDATIGSTRDVLVSPLKKVLLLELLTTSRVFDSEHPSSIDVLNDAADAIASSMLDVLPIWPSHADTALIREVDSQAIDELQAADIAAGWARELVELGNYRAVAQKFRRVYLNGSIVDRLL